MTDEEITKLTEENKELKAQVENLEKALKALPQLHDDAVAELAESKAQINKMKNCFNCKFTLLDENNFYRCKKGGFWQFCGRQDCEEWECKE